MKKFFLKIIVFLFFSTSLVSQGLLQINYARELSNFYWNGVLGFRLSRGTFDFYLYEKFSEMIIKTDKKYIRDDNDFKVGFYKRILPRLKTVFLLNSISFVDGKLSDLSKASLSEFFSGMKIYPFSNFGFYLLGGYKFDHQVDQKDKGWSYKISSDTLNFALSEYKLITNLDYYEDFIGSRKNILSALNLSVYRTFTQDVESKFEVFLKRIKRDFYFYADTNLQRIYNVNLNVEGRDERSILGLINLGYPISSNRLLLNLNLSVASKNVKKSIRYKLPQLYDSNISEFALNTSFGFSYSTEVMKAKIAFDYFERTEIHSPQRHSYMPEVLFQRIKQSEEQKTNKSFRRVINGEVIFRFSDSFEVGSNFYISLFRYDTPSPLNNDDRDELLQIFRLFLGIKISNEIKLEIPLDLNNQHLVYIFSERSINNNWNRVIKLSPSVIFESDMLRNKTNFAVLANYTIYDFESLSSSVKSYVFRQFYFNDSISLKISKRLYFNGKAQVVLSESGRLKWKEFKESPSVLIKAMEYKFNLNYLASDAIKLGIGYRIFDERRYRFVRLSRVPYSRISAVGPSSVIEMRNKNFSVIFDGWVERLNFEGRKSNMPNLSVNITVNL